MKKITLIFFIYFIQYLNVSSNEIKLEDDFLTNIEKILNLYKKNKNIILINMILFLTDYYFYKLQKKNIYNIEKINNNKHFVIKNINKFVDLNLNQNSLINSITSQLSNG